MADGIAFRFPCALRNVESPLVNNAGKLAPEPVVTVSGEAGGGAAGTFAWVTVRSCRGRVIQQGAREEIFFHPATRRVYEHNTELAATRVRQLIDDGTASGAFRAVHGAFVADSVAAIMSRIQTGAVLAATGLHDADAYDELAALVLDGIRAQHETPATAAEGPASPVSGFSRNFMRDSKSW